MPVSLVALKMWHWTVFDTIELYIVLSNLLDSVIRYRLAGMGQDEEFYSWAWE